MNAFLITLICIWSFGAASDLYASYSGKQLTKADAIAGLLRMVLMAWAIWLLAKG